MPRKLSVWWDHDGTRQYMVAAATKKEAARLLNTSVYSIGQWGGRITEPAAVALALSAPGTVFRRPIQHLGQLPRPWERDTGAKTADAPDAEISSG